MTDAKSRRSGGSVFATLTNTLLLLTFAMAMIWNQGQVEAHPYSHRRPNSYYYFEARLSHLYKALSSRIKSLEQTVNTLSGQECQSGTVNFEDCPGFKEASTQTINACVVSPMAGEDASVMDVTITFPTSFSRPPVVDVGFSGLAILGGKNCTVDVVSVSNNQFVIRQVSDDLLPLATQINYFACPSALMN